jgi:hypothetical protein
MEPGARWPALEPRGAILLALAAAAGVIIVLSADAQDLLIRWHWIRAEATIATEPLRGATPQQRGYPYAATFQFVLPDGQAILASSLKPLFAEPPPGPPSLTRVPPRRGDRLMVYVNPWQVDNAVPEREMLRGPPASSIFVHQLMFAALWGAMFRILSGRPLRNRP